MLLDCVSWSAVPQGHWLSGVNIHHGLSPHPARTSPYMAKAQPLLFLSLEHHPACRTSPHPPGGRPAPLAPQENQAPAACLVTSSSTSSQPLRLLRPLARPLHSVPGMASLLLLPLLLMLPLPAGANCPCQDPALCQPIHHHPDFEVSTSCLPLRLWSSRPERS